MPNYSLNNLKHLPESINSRMLDLLCSKQVLNSARKCYETILKFSNHSERFSETSKT